MTHGECVVLPAVFGGWLVRLSTREAGPYWSPEVAIQVAIAEALHLQRANRKSRIIVRNSTGAICAEYNLSRDAGTAAS